MHQRKAQDTWVVLSCAVLLESCRVGAYYFQSTSCSRAFLPPFKSPPSLNLSPSLFYSFLCTEYTFFHHQLTCLPKSFYTPSTSTVCPSTFSAFAPTDPFWKLCRKDNVFASKNLHWKWLCCAAKRLMGFQDKAMGFRSSLFILLPFLDFCFLAGCFSTLCFVRLADCNCFHPVCNFSSFK